jgi:O-antigen/teichoic acid export membrane protein
MREGHSVLTLLVIALSSLIALTLVVTTLFGREIILIVSNGTFAQYWFFLPFSCLGVGLFYLGQAYTYFGLALNHPEKYVSPKIGAGVASIVLTIISVRIMGLGGAVLSLCMVGLIYLASTLLVNAKMKELADIGS